MRLRHNIKLPKHVRFEYRPLYYDADKEELLERVARAKREHGIDTDGEYVPNIKGQFRPAARRINNQDIKRKSNIRLVIIVIALIVISNWVFDDIWMALINKYL